MGGIKRCFCLTSVCLTFVAYIGPKSRTERPRKTKIGTGVVHVTHNSDTTFKVKRSRSPGRFGWLFKSLHNLYVQNIIYNIIMYIIYATTQSEPLSVSHEYSWNKARWAPQA